jgi:hypothetical protein
MSVNCTSCTATLAERGYYCAACATQVRCKHCQEPLELHARACIMCGTSTGQNGTSTAGNGKPTAAINTLELEEDLKSRTVRLHLTDHAVAHVGDALTAVFADRLAGKPRTTQRIIQHVDTTPPLLPPPASEDTTTLLETAAPSRTAPTETDTDRQRLRQVFEYDTDELRLEEDRLKADSGLEYARRLTYLFLYAHELEGRKPVPYASLKRVLETAKIWDANTRHALLHKFAVEISDDQIRLKPKGRELAISALNEILDPNRADPGWTPDAKTRTAKPGADNDAKPKGTGKPGRKRSTQAEDWAAQWEKRTDHIDGHFALKTKRVHDKASLALWAIHKVGGKAASPGLIQRFIKAAFSHDEKLRSVINALARKDDLFLKVDGGYKLTPTGNKHAESIAKTV